jgi:hypothetical protein
LYIKKGTTVIRSVMYQMDSAKNVANMSIDALVEGDGSSIFTVGVIVKLAGTIYADGGTISGTGITAPGGAIYTWFSAHRIA